MQKRMIARAKELLNDNSIDRILGWKRGAFVYDITPGTFGTVNELEKDFVYDDFCGVNLSKYLVKESRKEGKVVVFLKKCDSYSFNELVKEHRINKDKVYVIGVQCDGKVDLRKIKDKGIDGITNITPARDHLLIETLYGTEKVDKDDVILDRCTYCRGRKHVAYDEFIGEDVAGDAEINQFDKVNEIEEMSCDMRFDFWQQELSKCIRCNACRNVCPACTCEKCMFDNPQSEFQSKASVDFIEDQLFHITRAMHVAGRCTDCGECQRVCPSNIPLTLINRKVIKDINEFYGEYQAGEDRESVGPLTSYKEKDKGCDSLW